MLMLKVEPNYNSNTCIFCLEKPKYLNENTKATNAFICKCPNAQQGYSWYRFIEGQFILPFFIWEHNLAGCRYLKKYYTVCKGWRRLKGV